MRKSYFLVLFVVLAALVILGASTPSASSAEQTAMKLISPNRIAAHVKFLSSDLLEGRGTGQRGGDIAGEYIATQFSLYGLKPAGDKGTYLQKVPMVGVTTEPQTSVSFNLQNGKSIPLKLWDDLVAMDETQNTTSDVESNLVFVGYGIQAPEYKWDDYKGVDLKGKVLLMLVNEPPSTDEKFFKGKALTYYGRWTYKYEEAARRGAAGAIIIHKTSMASYGWDVVRNSWGGERSTLRSESEPKLKLASWIQLGVAQDLVSAAGMNLDQLMQQATSRDFKPISLPVRVKSHVVSKIRPFDSFNVLAVLPGSDPVLSKQAVVYSAHYDHLGIHPDEKGDNIYNGAVDNGSGCGMLLEMARAFGAASAAPRRSILFAAVTGEEQGLLGSEFLGKNPPIPAGEIALGLNFDGLPPSGIPEEIDVSGGERSNFFPTVQATAKEFGLDIKPDANPGAGHYYRSDHFSFARVGIPSFSVNEGIKYQGHPAEYGTKLEDEYTEKHYHQPSDEFDPKWNFSGLAKVSQFGFELGWKAASQPGLVSWLPGDEFEAARKQSQSNQSSAGHQ